MTSTGSSSWEHVLRFAATLKRPPVCLKSLTRVQIRAKIRSATVQDARICSETHFIQLS